jgi:MFS family permease
MRRNSIYPPGSTNANWFSLFNAVSFQIILGSPMILYAKSIGATATVLGVIAALTPLLTVAQIPAAYVLHRVGYRRMILAGWTARTVFVFVLATIPLMDFLKPMARISLILMCLFIFNLLRGFSSGAWLPWLTDLIPEDVRGRFLSRDQFFLHVGCLVSLACSAALLKGESEPWRYAVIFVLSASAATASLAFLRLMPDIEPGEQLSHSNTRVPWREIILYPPFLRLTLFTVLFQVAISSLAVFNVSFMKDRLGFGENEVLYLTTAYFVGVLVFLPLMGRLADRLGSKPLLRVGTALWFVHVVMWGMIAAGVLPGARWMVGVTILGAGLAGAAFNIAHVRLLMNTMPSMGRSHFFAFFSVITSGALAATPVIWGMILDTLAGLDTSVAGLHVGKFTVYYACQALILIFAALMISLLHEKTARRRAEEAPPSAAPAPCE